MHMRKVMTNIIYNLYHLFLSEVKTEGEWILDLQVNFPTIMLQP